MCGRRAGSPRRAAAGGPRVLKLPAHGVGPASALPAPATALARRIPCRSANTFQSRRETGNGRASAGKEGLTQPRACGATRGTWLGWARLAANSGTSRDFVLLCDVSYAASGGPGRRARVPTNNDPIAAVRARRGAAARARLLILYTKRRHGHGSAMNSQELARLDVSSLGTFSSVFVTPGIDDIERKASGLLPSAPGSSRQDQESPRLQRADQRGPFAESGIAVVILLC